MTWKVLTSSRPLACGAAAAAGPSGQSGAAGGAPWPSGCAGAIGLALALVGAVPESADAQTDPGRSARERPGGADGQEVDSVARPAPGIPRLVPPSSAAVPAPGAVADERPDSVVVPAPGSVALERPDSVTIQPSERYAAGAVKQLLLGSGYRDVWSTPVRVPVLNLDTFAGGLTVLRAGGGRQTRTLHFEARDGRRYIFRSVDKFIERALPEDLQRTPVAELFQDHMSALHPTGALAVPPLAEAAGVLHVAPSLVTMPDDARLGEHRAVFAGMLGQIEERPNEGEDDSPGFAGARDIVGTETMLERLGEDPTGRADARGYLTARLLDFVIGDTDRGTDQWRWARSEQGGGRFVWRPIPRDRDWAFIRSTGVLASVARRVFPKLVAFGPDYPSLSGLLFSSIHHDRLLLAALDRSTWDSTAATMRARLDDDAIAAAVAALPPEHRPVIGASMAGALRARRDRLRDVASRFYEHFAGAVDVHGTDQPDVAEIELLPDGSVIVRLSPGRVRYAAAPIAGPPPAASRPYFERRFVPGETHEIRIDLGAGDDSAVVRGGASAITVRVVGGAGDDVLADLSAGAPDAGRVAFYDAAGRNTIERGPPGTRVDLRPFEPPEDPDDWVERKIVRDRYRDWGSSRSMRPHVEVREGAGIVVGVRSSATRYGFRRVPRASRIRVDGLYATGTERFGVEVVADRTWENSPWSAQVRAAATRYDAVRFYGYGNESAKPADAELALVLQDRLRLVPGLDVTLSPGTRLSFGLRADYTRPRYPDRSPVARAAPLGSRSAATLGVWAEGELRRIRGEPYPRNGVHLIGGVAAAAAGTRDVAAFGSGFGAMFAEARSYVTFGPTLAVRAGGRRVAGDFPIQDAAFVGGRSTLRGYRYQRFAGDAALYGSAELRAPLARVTMLVRGDVGLLGFADAGRVFVDGASPGGWHTATGGGVWFSSLGTTLSATFAAGEERRLYLDLGMPF